MVVNDSPLVSIITPVCNGAEYLEELIESVRNQDYPRMEHIVIDDGSRDDGATLAILHRHSHLVWWSHPNRGQYATMNEGLQAAQGELVCFVSADDLLTPGAVRAAVRYLEAHPDKDGVFGSTNYIDSDGQTYPLRVPFRMASMRFIPYFAHVSHCSLYVKRASLLNCGLTFDPALRLVGDYEWMIRLSKSRLQISAMDRVLSEVRIHPKQISQQEHHTSLAERRMVLNRYKINRVSHFLLFNLYLMASRWMKLQSKIKAALG